MKRSPDERRTRVGAAVVPRRAFDPVPIDPSLSEVARDKVMRAAHADRPIPAG
ncbi:MAG: hypothetical protein U5L05_17235 [Rubrivivax sp.]|nr:hypothetical protein [Rubrivivax sp.]